EDFAEQAGFSLNWVPYEAGSDALPALLGNHVDAILTNLVVVKSEVDAGEVRVLGVSTEDPIDDLPDDSTFNELREDGLVSDHWRGFYAKEGTRDEVIETLDDVFEKVSETSEWKDFLEENGAANNYTNEEESREEINQELQEFDEKINQ